jgi:hypothetical protein
MTGGTLPGVTPLRNPYVALLPDLGLVRLAGTCTMSKRRAPSSSVATAAGGLIT